MSEIFKLYRLQQLDSQLDRIRARLKEIEAILANDEEVEQAMDVLDAAKKARVEAEKGLKFAEEEVREQEIKIEHNQASLYGGSITNPKELEDLQAEAAALKRQLSKQEDGQLEQMERLEGASSQEQLAQEALDKLAAAKQHEQGELLLEQKGLILDSERLEGEVETAAGSIAGSDLAVYSKTREKKKGLAVAKVEAEACSACGNQLSQALLQNARQAEQISFCSTCKRILYAG